MARISDEQKDRIIHDLLGTRNKPEGAFRQIAARHGVSDWSVRKIAKEIGLNTEISSRERTRNATRALVADGAARRQALAERLLDEAQKALDSMHRPCVAYNFGGKDNTFNEHEIREPSFADKRNLMIIAATALDKHKMLDQYDSNESLANAVDEWLRSHVPPLEADEPL